MFQLIQGCVRKIILEHTQPRLEVSKNQLKICVGSGCVKIPCLMLFQPLIFQGCVFVVNGCFVICWQSTFCSRATFQLMHFCASLISMILEMWRWNKHDLFGSATFEVGAHSMILEMWRWNTTANQKLAVRHSLGDWNFTLGKHRQSWSLILDSFQN